MGKVSYRSVRTGSLKELNRVKCTFTGGVTVRSSLFTVLSPVLRRTDCDWVYWVIFSLPCPDKEAGSDRGSNLPAGKIAFWYKLYRRIALFGLILNSFHSNSLAYSNVNKASLNISRFGQI